MQRRKHLPAALTDLFSPLFSFSFFPDWSSHHTQRLHERHTHTGRVIFGVLLLLHLDLLVNALVELDLRPKAVPPNGATIRGAIPRTAAETPRNAPATAARSAALVVTAHELLATCLGGKQSSLRFGDDNQSGEPIGNGNDSVQC